jgi:hypothetical protein
VAFAGPLSAMMSLRHSPGLEVPTNGPSVYLSLSRVRAAALRRGAFMLAKSWADYSGMLTGRDRA